MANDYTGLIFSLKMKLISDAMIFTGSSKTKIYSNCIYILKCLRWTPSSKGKKALYSEHKIVFLFCEYISPGTASTWNVRVGIHMCIH